MNKITVFFYRCCSYRRRLCAENRGAMAENMNNTKFSKKKHGKLLGTVVNSIAFENGAGRKVTVISVK